MAEYRVSWSIDIDAESPEAAAEQAEKIMLDPERLGNVFEVRSRDSTDTELIEVDPEGVGHFVDMARKDG